MLLLWEVVADSWAVSPRSQAVSSWANDGDPLLHACVANPFIEEPDAIELARPDLRGAGEGDLPGLPDPFARVLASAVPEGLLYSRLSASRRSTFAMKRDEGKG